MKLTVMRGLPGSGKSTHAADIMKQSGNTIRVNRDELRPMLHGPDTPWSKDREKATVAAEIGIVKNALFEGRNVIVDDTNILGPATELWESVVTNVNLHLEAEALDDDDNTSQHVSMTVVDTMKEVSIEECIQRDHKRQGKARVGRGVIERMALSGGLIDLSKEERIAVVDIDGTLSDLDHRLPYLQKTPKDYAGFFSNVIQDGTFWSVVQAVRRLHEQGYYVIILSGRPTTVGFETNLWLTVRLPFHRLFMRNGGDHRPDDQVKRQLMEQMFKSGLRKDAIKIVIDDRDSVCVVWRELGLPLVQVSRGAAIQIEPNALRMAVEFGIPINGADVAV